MCYHWRCCGCVIKQMTHMFSLWEVPKQRRTVGMETNWRLLPVSGMLGFIAEGVNGVYALFFHYSLLLLIRN